MNGLMTLTICRSLGVFPLIPHHPSAGICETIRLLHRYQDFALASRGGHFQVLMGRANEIMMVVFRVAQFAAIAAAVVSLFRGRERGGFAAAGFLLVLGCYAGPYLIGFAYQRHVMVMVFPILIYAASALDTARSCTRDIVVNGACGD